MLSLHRSLMRFVLMLTLRDRSKLKLYWEHAYSPDLHGLTSQLVFVTVVAFIYIPLMAVSSYVLIDSKCI